jgi:hypothetical protein
VCQPELPPRPPGMRRRRYLRLRARYQQTELELALAVLVELRRQGAALGPGRRGQALAVALPPWPVSPTGEVLGATATLREALRWWRRGLRAERRWRQHVPADGDAAERGAW